MKGVIVQIGEPKSIVLLNNGKLMAIPTPANCQIGTVVSVKTTDLLKIIIIVLAAVLVLTLGILIGANFLGGKTDESSNNFWYEGHGGHGRGRMMQQCR